MKVLVVGGAGYIGSHVVRALRSAGHELVIFDNFSTGHRTACEGFEVFEGDVKDGADLKRVFSEHAFDMVMHFAAKALVGESVEHPLFYFHENVGGGINLLSAMHEAGVRQIIFSSTAATYGNPDRMPISEDFAPKPVNPYGQSKRMVEEIMDDLSKKGRLRYISLRYFNAAGASLDGSIGEVHTHETHLIPRMLQAALEAKRKETHAVVDVYGNDYPTKDGSCVRDFIHVVDLAAAHLLAMTALQKGHPSTIYNVGSEHGFSVLEVIAEAERITGVTIEPRFLPRRPGDPPTLVASSKKIARDLGFQTRHSTIHEILATAWQWEMSRKR